MLKEWQLYQPFYETKKDNQQGFKYFAQFLSKHTTKEWVELIYLANHLSFQL